MPSLITGDLPFNLSSHAGAVGVTDELRGLSTVVHAEDLVGCAQVLLYSGLGKEEALRYLCITKVLSDQRQYLPLARGERVELCRHLVGHFIYQVSEHPPRYYLLPPCDDRDSAGHLVWVHPRVDKATGPGLQSCHGQWQILVQAKD